MAERKKLSKKIRFEVFKRDKFTCQYCGRMAPDVVLEVDHINPVSKGGSNDIMNLVTSCFECNRGKSDKKLGDDSAIKKQQDQLAQLAEKNEQLEMMLKWREGLMDIKEKEAKKFVDYFNNKSLCDFCMNENGLKTIKKWLREFSIIELMDATDIAFDQYYDGTLDSVGEIIDKIPGICANKKRGQSSQSYWYNYLKKACSNRYAGVDYDDLKAICFRYIKTQEDFDIARTILYENGNGYWFLKNLREYFE